MARYLQTEEGRKWIQKKKPWLLQGKECFAARGKKTTLINNWKRAHPGGNYREHLEEVYGYELPKCSCGCGEKVLTIGNKYVHGHNRPWLGKKRPSLTDEVKDKMRVSHLGRKYNMTDEGLKVCRENCRKMHTPENRMKTTLKLRGRKQTPDHVRNAMRRRPITSLELAFKKIVDDNGLPYKFVGNGAFIIDGLNPDFINTNGDKIAIEVYARMYKEIGGRTVKKYKADRIKRLSPFGWKIYFFDELQVKPEFVLNTLGGYSN
jgi:hypothetical protein